MNSSSRFIIVSFVRDALQPRQDIAHCAICAAPGTACPVTKSKPAILFPTLPSINPAADVLAMSCSCKSGSKSGGTLQKDHRRPKNVVTTLRKRRPDELPHFFERFPNWHPIREARKFPCHIPTMAQTTIQPRAFAEWRTNFNCLPVSFERQKEKNRHRPRLLFFFRHA